MKFTSDKYGLEHLELQGRCDYPVHIPYSENAQLKFLSTDLIKLESKAKKTFWLIPRLQTLYALHPDNVIGVEGKYFSDPYVVNKNEDLTEDIRKRSYIDALLADLVKEHPKVLPFLARNLNEAFPLRAK